MKRVTAFLVAGILLVITGSLYLMLDVGTGGDKMQQQNLLQRLDSKIDSIERKVKLNVDKMNLIQRSIDDRKRNALNYEIHDPKPRTTDRPQRIIRTNKTSNGIDRSFSEYCLKDGVFSKPLSPHTKTVNIDMLEMYRNKLSFDNINGGVWKQGYDISYNASRWKEQKLKVFVVPHSHCDPGWVKTYDVYYKTQVVPILNNMILKLTQYPDMTFIYAEISFFSRWFQDLDVSRRNRVRDLINNHQLEIVTGGWVMNDEASTHYGAMVSQMLDGHEWLWKNLNMRPRSGWAIDPFGLSTTMAYLLKRMGLENMLIHRVHYSVKKQLAHSKSLEFHWRQPWDGDGSTDILCHIEPFYSYDIPHSCGPDPKICCQYDFVRVPGSKMKCPWGIGPQAITTTNVEAKASVLLDQYRKKASLFHNDVVLIPLGDDFRYEKLQEWDKQHENYMKLFNYMNSQHNWNVEVKFGTLSEYFDEVRIRATYQKAESAKALHEYPSLSGDFFTYADRNEDYWSGYFTSRPFYKRLIREAEGRLRMTEILFSLAYSRINSAPRRKSFPYEDLIQKMTIARQHIGLFQHHDGITGTAKDFVVVDYGKRIMDALFKLNHISTISTQFLIEPSLTAAAGDYLSNALTTYLDVNEIRRDHDVLPEMPVIQISPHQSRKIVVFNSLTFRRKRVVTILVSSPNIILSLCQKSSSTPVPVQIGPYWTSPTDMAVSAFQVDFLADLPPWAILIFDLRHAGSDPDPGVASSRTGSAGDIKSANLSSTEFFNAPKEDIHVSKTDEMLFNVVSHPSQPFIIENRQMKVYFAACGLLGKVETEDRIVTTKIDFIKYGTTSTKEKSGAYLFLPHGKAHLLNLCNTSPVVRITRGALFSRVTTFIAPFVHTVTLYNSADPVGDNAINIDNLVDIRKASNEEYGMRLSTSIENTDRTFYTDGNGFQLLKRRTLDKLPLQGNLYPMASMTVIKDKSTELTLVSAQPLGVSALEVGVVDILLDRRLSQDDSRGLGQGIQDNKVTPNSFSLLIYSISPPDDVSSHSVPSQMAAYPSLLANLASLSLLNPLAVFHQKMSTAIPSPAAPKDGGGPNSDQDKTGLQHFLAFSSSEAVHLPCNMHVVNMRMQQDPESSPDAPSTARAHALLTVHNQGFSCAAVSHQSLLTEHACPRRPFSDSIPVSFFSDEKHGLNTQKHFETSLTDVFPPTTEPSPTIGKFSDFIRRPEVVIGAMEMKSVRIIFNDQPISDP